jgi:lambda repressor-like predicted transcriptional regulator
VRLRDSLSNPGAPLSRLIKEREEASWPAEPLVSGEVVEALIAQTGISDRADVRLAIKENRKLTPGEVADLVVRYEAGASIRSLGTTFGLHEQTVRAHLRRQGVAVRSVRAFTEAQEAEVVRQYLEEVWSLAELAAKFGVSESAVRNALVRQGVERRAQARRKRD